MGTFLFSENDPLHFRNLQTSMLSLFRAVTLEACTDLLYINMYGSANFGYEESTYKMLEELGYQEVKSSAAPIVSSIYFISFILTGAMIVLNLFVGVMLTGMDEAKKENELLKVRNDETN